jgi:hypothetical protein
MNRFLTQKPCFNSINDFPHTTFNWYVNHGFELCFLGLEVGAAGLGYRLPIYACLS